MSPILFDYELKQKCSLLDLKSLICMAGTLHNTKIDDLYRILQLFRENQIIDYNYLMDDIKDEISISRCIIYNVETGIIINELINYETTLFTIDSYISTIKTNVR